MVITLPCVLLLLDFWPLRRIQGWSELSSPRLGGRNQEIRPGRVNPRTTLPVSQVPFSRLVLEKLPLFALSGADGIVTIFAQRSYGSMHLVLPLWVRSENAVYAYAMYVWKGFWPARLAVFYPYPATLSGWQLGLAAGIYGDSKRTGVARSCVPSLPCDRLALVPRHSGAGDWAHPGWRAGDGRPLCLHPDDWNLRDGGLECCRVG